VLGEENRFAFSPSLLIAHTEGVWSAAVAILIIGSRRDWRHLAFPLVMLLTVTMIHLNHRPWWGYYYLHFAVPLAWLTGFGISRLLGASCLATENPGLLGAMASRLVGSVLLALVLVSGGGRFLDIAGRVVELPRVKDSVMVAKMREYAAETKWVYTRGDIRVFHAGLAVIPELAVIPAKRIWSGRLTDDQILALVKRYRPEQIILDMTHPDMDTELKKLVPELYQSVCEEQGRRLWVLKSILHRS
jgi:hypothetical protein